MSTLHWPRSMPAAKALIWNWWICEASSLRSTKFWCWISTTSPPNAAGKSSKPRYVAWACAFSCRATIWLAGFAPVLEKLLLQAPDEARHELFRHLLRLECEYRQKQGRGLEAEEAWQRFGSLGPWAHAVLAAIGLEEPGDQLVLNVLSGP